MVAFRNTIAVFDFEALLFHSRALLDRITFFITKQIYDQACDKPTKIKNVLNNLRIQDDILEGKFELVWSYILDAENSANPFEERKRPIWDWRQYAIIHIKEDPPILEKAKKIIQLGLRSKDALHISCAVSAGCGYFLITDDQVLNRGKSIEDLAVVDPISFIREVYS